MRDYHGIVFAYHDEPALRDLTANRTAASLPFCSRYRLIDFALSSWTWASSCSGTISPCWTTSAAARPGI